MVHDVSEPRRQGSRREIFVVDLEYTSTCSRCDATDVFVLRLLGGPRCLGCSQLGDLEFLPSGNAALSRRAAKRSRRCVAVMQAHPVRKRFERQGILVDPAAIEHAARESLADATPQHMTPRQRVRAQRDKQFQTELAAAIRAGFPGCPTERAEAIALHAAAVSSRRIDRVVNDAVVRAAVFASILHVDTDYADRVLSGVRREAARAQVYERVEHVAASWREGVTMLDD